jgi:hypothetical protein
MEDLSNLDTIADRQSLAPVHPPTSKAPRLPWHRPVLQRSNVALDTGTGRRALTNDGNRLSS